MRTLFVHIGLPKTASTFLQDRIFPELVDRHVICTPDNHHFKRASGERLLKLVFDRSDTIWRHDADAVLTAILGVGWQDDLRDILISDEAIGRTASRQGLLSAHLSGLAAAVGERGIERVKLLCMVRRQDHWLASHYVQLSDRRLAARQADFVKLTERICDPRAARFTFGALLDYAAIRDACVAALGPDAVTFLPLEWLEFHPEELGSRLTRFLELQPDELDLRRSRRENVRRAGEGLWELRQPSTLAGRLAGALHRRQKYIALRPELSSRILEAYYQSNVALSQATGIDLGSLGYFPPGETGPRA